MVHPVAHQVFDTLLEQDALRAGIAKITHAILCAIPLLLQRYGIPVETDEVIAYIEEKLDMPPVDIDSPLDKQGELKLAMLLAG